VSLVAVFGYQGDEVARGFTFALTDADFRPPLLAVDLRACQ
jgi:hypothetical protein